MTALLVVLMFLGFVAIDVLVRVVHRRLDEARERREREAALQTSLRLDFTAEAKSLKRVEVSKPRARILAVDDEPVVLDSFRKILVLAGFDVDTVESGPEALGLVQRRDYDFVFTDLKMPGMDGVEVVKAVRHLRPDVDVAVITGYGTIETAVQTMQHGAVDYVQKPFTEDELLEFARKLLLRRQARLEAQREPSVRIVAPSVAETAGVHEYCVPGGAVERGEPLFAVGRAGRKAHFAAPMSGKVVQVNEALADDPTLLTRSPYGKGWVCVLQPKDLAGELGSLRIGEPVVAWYRAEIERLHRTSDAARSDAAEEWAAFEQEFLLPAAAAP
jgi:CheY-like chemotaxis protein